jgi:hypothetical protein
VFGTVPGEEGLEPEPEGLDLLELRDGQGRDARAASGEADDEPFALQAPERVTDRSQADVEAPGELFQPEPLIGAEPEAADLLPERAVDALLDRCDVQGGSQGGSLSFDL